MPTANPLDLLEALGPRARRRFEQLTERVKLPAGDTLFRQGSPPDAMYLVVAGSLGVYTFGPSHERQLIAVIEAGETVGEMAVIASTPRSATVIAIRDCVLLKMSKASFDQMQKREPELMSGLNRILVHRLRRISRGQGMRLEPKTVAILPVTNDIAAEPIAHRLATILEQDGFSVRLVGLEDRKRPSGWFDEQEANHDHLILCGDHGHEEWIRLCARQADRIMVAARAGDAVRTDLPGDLLQQRADHQLLDLVVLHDQDASQPQGSARWHELIPMNRLFHIRKSREEDWQRLARVIGGRAVGVVLSGGGARAYAHIGALKAISEYGLSIDFIGGVSMGAIIGAGIARGWSIDELSNNVQRAFVSSNPLSDLTLPLIGLVKGRKVERLLKEYFGALDIADLWLPYYCVSSNLSDGTLCVHRSGLLRDALRASIALPGVLPPKIIGDHVLADGAVLNNLPVDVMRSLHRGPIIAVDVTRDGALRPEMLAISHRSSWMKMLRHPPIISILMRAGTVSSDAEIEKQADYADVVIEPQLGDIDIRNWRAFDQAVTIGYEHTGEALSKSVRALSRRRRKSLP